MSAVDRIRDKAEWAKEMKVPGGVTVSISGDEAEALADLADAAREVCTVYYDGELDATYCNACGDRVDLCECHAQDARDAFARLDAE